MTETDYDTVKSDYMNTCTCSDKDADKVPCTQRVGMGRMWELRVAKMEGSPSDATNCRMLDCISAAQYEREHGGKPMFKVDKLYVCRQGYASIFGLHESAGKSLDGIVMVTEYDA